MLEMNDKLDQLTNLYMEQSEQAKTNSYAQWGALGVSPAHVILYEEAIEKIEAFASIRKSRAAA